MDPMPTLVQFGAGAIGRGFIAPLFHAAGWRIVFVEADPGLRAGLQRDRRYRLIEVDGSGEHTVLVGPIEVLAADDPAGVAQAVAEADLLATAVGIAVLPQLAGVIAAGLKIRLQALDTLVCENGVGAVGLLRGAVLAELPAGQRGAIGGRFGCVRTSIGRMVPPGQGGVDLRIEPYGRLPVERAAFTGPVPVVPGIVACEDFLLIERQKLHLHNLTHAVLAYGGARRGLTTIPDCVADPGLRAAMLAAGAEMARALGRLHGPAAEAESFALLADLRQRYGNRRLGDPVVRVARDPQRKLGRDERLIGSARLCGEAGVPCPAIIQACAWALEYAPPPDAGAWVAPWKALQQQGRERLLSTVAGLSPEDPLMQAIITTHDRERIRRDAADRLSAAGVRLLPPECEALEIADFGLGRFAEFGLVIHVYVNTARCCAKELVMTPGQVCPEHRHPPVEGDPGKEETFRVRAGEVHLYVPGPDMMAAEHTAAVTRLPPDKRDTVRVYRHIHLTAGMQYTLVPNTPHWFVAGTEGAVVSEFSTRSRDEADVFTDPAIIRCPVEA